MALGSLNPGHGGLLFPLDPFRPRILAHAIAEALVAKARNINDAQLVLTRHPQAGLVLASVSGSVVGDPGTFWRENADIAMYASQALPRQCFLYFVVRSPQRREGFMVAQRGQILAADEGTPENMPADATDAEWPVARLAQQIRIEMAELEDGFAGGPSIELSLIDPSGDDETLLMTLAGQAPENIAEEVEETPAATPPPARPTASATEQDLQRRAAEQQAERAERDARAQQARTGLTYALDELGIVVAPQAELADTDILAPYLARDVRGDPPPGIPRELVDPLQHKRVDFAVRVDFLSEVFTESGPLTRPVFEQQSTTRRLGDIEVRALEVLAPRLGTGTLVRRGTTGVFLSRRVDEPWPEALVAALLEQG
jgi:hypothetical protein